ncbi:MAG: DinB family protein [Anaerolineales bacterium]|nr:DinB family protein [Anaerolineales bacterium]
MTSARLDSLVSRLEKGRLKTAELFNALTDEQWSQPLYTDPCAWDVRALLAHFLSSEVRLLQLAQDVARGGEGVGADFDLDEFNAEEQRLLEGKSPSELLEALDAARQATIAWVRSLQDEQLDCLGRHPALGVISLENNVLAIYGHQLMHARDLKARLGKNLAGQTDTGQD